MHASSFVHTKQGSPVSAVSLAVWCKLGRNSTNAENVCTNGGVDIKINTSCSKEASTFRRLHNYSNIVCRKKTVDSFKSFEKLSPLGKVNRTKGYKISKLLNNGLELDSLFQLWRFQTLWFLTDRWFSVNLPTKTEILLSCSRRYSWILSPYSEVYWTIHLHFGSLK